MVPLSSSSGAEMARVVPGNPGWNVFFLTYLAVVAARIATSLTTHSTVITFSVILAIIASPPVMVIQVIANMYCIRLVRAIARRRILRDPKLGCCRGQGMVSSAKLITWLEPHPGVLESWSPELSLDPRIPRSVPSAPLLCHWGTLNGRTPQGRDGQLRLRFGTTPTAVVSEPFAGLALDCANAS